MCRSPGPATVAGVLAAAAALLCGCGRQAGDCDDPGRQIAGVVFRQDQLFRSVETGMHNAADEANVTLRVDNTDNRPEEEGRLVEAYIVQGVDAMVISPLGASASIPALRRAHEKGIKIVTYHTPLQADFPVCHVEISQSELGAGTGRACRRYIEQELGGRATIAMISFVDRDSQTASARCEGFSSEVAKLPGAVLLPQQEASDATTADRVVGAILTANPQVNIVWAANQGGTQGAVTAVKRLGKAGKVAVFGTELNKKLAELLLSDDDVLQAVTAQQPHEIGRRAVLAAVDALDGKPVDKRLALPGVLFSREKPDRVRSQLDQ